VLQDFEATIEDHRTLFHQVIQCGTYLRFFSNKNEALKTAGKDLPDVIVRWRHLLLKACKTRHSLEDAYQTSRRVIFCFEIARAAFEITVNLYGMNR